MTINEAILDLGRLANQLGGNSELIVVIFQHDASEVEFDIDEIAVRGSLPVIVISE